MMDEAKEVLVPTVVVTIGKEKFEIGPFSFSQRLKIYAMLAEAAGSSAAMQQGQAGKQAPAMVISEMIKLIGDNIMLIFSDILGRDRTWIDKHVGIKEEADLVEAILEVNDFPLLISRMKGVGEKFQKKFVSLNASPGESAPPQQSSQPS